MSVDLTVVPGFVLLLAEFAALAAVGYVVARVALRQDDVRMALAQGLVIGLALWGLITNFVLYAVPGMAGAAIGWGLTLGLGAVLAWRAPARIRPTPRVLAGFVAAVLALFWIALASRQLLTFSDPQLHLGMAGAFRAGGFPPELSWSPGEPLRYHYAAQLLVGLLAPPFGPDLAFAAEVLGAYAWTGFALVVVTLLLARGSWQVALLLSPLLLAPGLWTGTTVGSGILQAPVPAGLPEAGLRASLAETYWSSTGETWSRFEAALPNIRKPSFLLAYALAMIVLERAARPGGRSWRSVGTLAGLVGGLGLLSTPLTPLVLGLWAGFEALDVRRAWRGRHPAWRTVLRPGAGLVLAVVLLLAGGGRFTGMLEGAASSGLAFWWEDNAESWRLLGGFNAQPGGLGLVSIGPVVAAAIAALLAWRDRLVVALAMGAGLLALGWLVLRYEPHPADLNRLMGHAQNFALLALLLAMSARLAGLRPRWRYAASALLVGLIIWPTSVVPVRNLGLAVAQGIEVSNATWAEAPTARTWPGRGALPPVSARVVAFIRDRTAVDARVFVPEEYFWKITAATGRPNSAGYPNLSYMRYAFGPEYLDVRDHLEPGAMRRLGIDYLYAPDAWVAGLPDRARGWLGDPELFELVVRDGAESLYRVQPAFLALDVPPAPATFEALRQAVPAETAVYWPSGAPFETDTTLRVASVLAPEAELHGELKYALRRLHALTSVPVEPLGDRIPDLVLVPVGLDPWMFPPEGRQPIWWNEEMAIYAPDGAVAPVRPPAEAAPSEPAPIDVRVSDVRVANGQIAFSLTVDDHSPERWTGQDWALVAVDGGPWSIPRRLESDQRTLVAEQWFVGQIVRGRGTTTHAYVYDALASSLAVRSGDGTYRTETSSGGDEGPGTWALALRLLREEDRGTYVAHEQAALIPVLKITVSPAGEVSYEVYDAVGDE